MNVRLLFLDGSICSYKDVERMYNEGDFVCMVVNEELLKFSKVNLVCAMVKWVIIIFDKL